MENRRMADYTCLVVEDSPSMRQLLGLALSRVKGLEVVEAGDGVEGLKLLSTSKFDIVIIDINMPIMDGLKLLKHIRSDARHSDIPVVVVTTEGFEETRDRALHLGVDAYLVKPIQAPLVIAKVKELLGIAR
jgi:two-component system chemotaxis response regulator CheY